MSVKASTFNQNKAVSLEKEVIRNTMVIFFKIMIV